MSDPDWKLIIPDPEPKHCLYVSPLLPRPDPDSLIDLETDTANTTTVSVVEEFDPLTDQSQEPYITLSLQCSAFKTKFVLKKGPTRLRICNKVANPG